MNKRIIFEIVCLILLILLTTSTAIAFYQTISSKKTIEFRHLVVNISDTAYPVITSEICNITTWMNGTLELNDTLAVDAAGWHYYTYTNNTSGHRACGIFCTGGKPFDCSFTINNTSTCDIWDNDVCEIRETTGVSP